MAVMGVCVYVAASMVAPNHVWVIVCNVCVAECCVIHVFVPVCMYVCACMRVFAYVANQACM